MEDFKINFEYIPLQDRSKPIMIKCVHSHKVICTKCQPDSFPRKYLSQSDPSTAPRTYPRGRSGLSNSGAF